jgi:hypothetical protein
VICTKCATENHSMTVGFKASCEKCGVFLHSCVQCALWDRGSMHCRSLTTEHVGDREGLNFCEEYVPNTVHNGASGGSCSSGRAREKFLDLFGREDGK